ncbi:hypothetical protein ABK040_016701 [Willaertia magna]
MQKSNLTLGSSSFISGSSMFNIDTSFNNNNTSSNTIQPGKLAQQIKDWCLNELHLPEEKIPQVFHIRELCRGNMIPIWKFLLNYMHHPNKVDFIKKNIKLNGSKVQNDLEKEKKKRETLLKEIEKKKQRIQELKNKQIPTIENEIKNLRNSNYQSQINNKKQLNENNFQLKQFILFRGFDEKCRFEINLLNEYFQRINLISHQLLNKRNCNANQIRKIFEEKSNVILQKELINEKEILLDNNRSILKNNQNLESNNFGNVVYGVVPIQWIESLIEISREHGIVMKQMIDDLFNKKNKLEEKNIIGIEQLLEVERRKHIAKYLESEQINKMVISQKQQVEIIKGEISNLLKGNNVEKNNLIIQLMESEMTLSEVRASRLILEEYIASLTQEREEKRKIKQGLLSKQHEIQILKEKRKYKSKRISEYNESSDKILKGLQKQQEQVIDFVKERMEYIQQLLPNLTINLSNIFELELSYVTKIPRDYLYSINIMDNNNKKINRIMLKDLSINQLDDYTEDVKSLIDNINFPNYKAPEYLLTHLKDLKQEAQTKLNEREIQYDLLMNIKQIESQMDDSIVGGTIDLNSQLEHTQQNEWLSTIQQTLAELLMKLIGII